MMVSDIDVVISFENSPVDYDGRIFPRSPVYSPTTSPADRTAPSSDSVYSPTTLPAYRSAYRTASPSDSSPMDPSI